MAKMAGGQLEEGMEINAGNLEKIESELDPKIVAAYKKLGLVMKSYRSGKLPRAFKVIP